MSKGAVKLSNQVPVAAGRIPEVLGPILHEVKATLEAIYGDRLQGLILFGSWARGDATDGSDIDILVVLDDVKDAVSELDMYASDIYEIDLKYDVVISTVPADAREFASLNIPLFICARQEGIAI